MDKSLRNLLAALPTEDRDAVILNDSIGRPQTYTIVNRSGALDAPSIERGAEPTAVAGRWLNVDQAAELVGTTPYEVRLAVLHEKIPCRLERVAVYQWWEQVVRGTPDQVGGR